MNVTHGTGVVQNGQVVLDAPLNLPDGTVVELTAGAPGPDDPDADWDTSPEAIAEWEAWLESATPLRVTPDEEAAADAWLRESARYGLEKLQQDARDMFR